MLIKCHRVGGRLYFHMPIFEIQIRGRILPFFFSIALAKSFQTFFTPNCVSNGPWQRKNAFLTACNFSISDEKSLKMFDVPRSLRKNLKFDMSWQKCWLCCVINVSRVRTSNRVRSLFCPQSKCVTTIHTTDTIRYVVDMQEKKNGGLV